MQKHPSSLAVLAEIFYAVAENFQMDLVVLKDICGKQKKFAKYFFESLKTVFYRVNLLYKVLNLY